MLRPNQQFVRSVLLGLMLIVGSVQAHVSYFCGIMETVVHDDCCCVDFDSDDMTLIEGEPCCEKSVGLVVDASTDQGPTTAKPIKFQSDVDPPTLPFLPSHSHWCLRKFRLYPVPITQKHYIPPVVLPI